MIEEPQALDHLAGLLHESVIEVEGVAVVNPQAPGGVEVHRPEIRVLAPSAAVPLVELYYPTPKSDPADAVGPRRAYAPSSARAGPVRFVRGSVCRLPGRAAIARIR